MFTFHMESAYKLRSNVTMHSVQLLRISSCIYITKLYFFNRRSYLKPQNIIAGVSTVQTLI